MIQYLIMFVFFIGVALACKVGQVKDGEDCIDICFQKYFNPITGDCENYSSCDTWEYLNLTTNICESTCPNGYFLNGTCTCYSGYKLSSETCKYDNQTTNTQDSALGLSWFIWGLISIFTINAIYIVSAYIYYRRKRSLQFHI